MSVEDEEVVKPHFWILRLGEMTLKSRPVRRHFQSCMEQSLLDLALLAGIDPAYRAHRRIDNRLIT